MNASGHRFHLWFLVLTLVVLISVFALDTWRTLQGFNTMSYRVWTRFSGYDRVHAGMNKADVLSLLGKPITKEPNPEVTKWFYNVTLPKPEVYGINGVRYTTRTQVVYIGFGTNGRVAVLRLGPYWPHGAVRIGMTGQQVQRIAGKPIRIDRSRLAETWRYPDWNHTRHRVDFDSGGRVIGMLEFYRTTRCEGIYRGVSIFHR